MTRKMMITVVLMAGSVAAAIAAPQVDHVISPNILPLASLAVVFAPQIAGNASCELTAPYRRLHETYLKVGPSCAPNSSS